MDEHDLLIRACGRILSGFYLLAGRSDLARRVRISLPRQGRPRNGDASEASSETGEPNADANADASDSADAVASADR